jgi:dipeptidyl aminopeptidase/acylaminoacyl peptidase
VDRRHVLTGLLGVAGLSAAQPRAALAAAIDRASAMPKVIQHQISPAGMPPVELFQASPDAADPSGAILFVHGYQGGRFIGARETVDTGTLLRFCRRLNITAAAVSQPGFGASKGPPDFCGPATQRAISSALSFLRSQPNVDPGRIILYGLSRGAMASAMVATQDNDLRALILAAGVYDLEAAYRTASRGIRRSIEREAGTTSEAFAARSALRHADKIRSETLLLHGRHDDRAPVAQAEQLAKALSDAGTAVSLNVFDCGHRIPREFSSAAMRPLLRKVFGPFTGDNGEN